MREIVTLQLGSFSNFVGAHYWNIQVASPPARAGVAPPPGPPPETPFRPRYRAPPRATRPSLGGRDRAPARTTREGTRRDT